MLQTVDDMYLLHRQACFSGFIRDHMSKVAAQLQFSESLLRHLLLALQAPACDRDLARQGKISTNELARRGNLVTTAISQFLPVLPAVPVPIGRS